ncbi:hypothetical protein GTP38_11135 [Duganella sp. FT94W]|uniref:DUF1828 domain-containing protein n=1 Tax=Duganella lactea TaxID=2692173 RepID=A0ABW9V6F2_9BURK|nr:hypothetical protein [Duganella lactea]MYM34893.1 hypothetical protein [Duganella lactea]
MVFNKNLKQQICSLFEVHDDGHGVQRVVTPLEYPMTGDRIVVRVRERGHEISIDENGDTALYASMAGGDVDSDAVNRWLEDLKVSSAVSLEEDTLKATTQHAELVAPYIFRVAEAAQQLFAISTSRTTRHANDFKQRVAAVIADTAASLALNYAEDVELPMAGGLTADFVIEANRPLIVIAATSLTRLLEAEIIHMQYKLSNRPGFVVAVAESQAAVGKKQFERANYYTDKTVSFSPHDFRQLITASLH